MMTPKQKLAHRVRVSIVTFLAVLAWLIVADIWIPLTPDSTVMRVVTPVSSRVSGYALQIHIHNNNQMKKGDSLYELDPTPFINKVKAVQIAPEQTKLGNQRLGVQIVSARANLRTVQFNAHNDKITFGRYQRLGATQGVLQSDLDKVRTAWQINEQLVVVLNANIQNLLIQCSECDDKCNITLQKYCNTLKETQLNPGWNKVYTQTSDTMSNLQLSPGPYTTAATPLLVLVSYQTDIMADLREEGPHHTKVDTDAAVVFDVLPGKVFFTRVISSDAGILADQEQVSGQSPQPEQLTHWVRDAQHTHIHVALNKPFDTPLLTGACATMQLYNNEGMFARIFTGTQIHFVSWLHYAH